MYSNVYSMPCMRECFDESENMHASCCSANN
jgi:hypothetical protein